MVVSCLLFQLLRSFGYKMLWVVLMIDLIFGAEDILAVVPIAWSLRWSRVRFCCLEYFANYIRRVFRSSCLDKIPV